MTNHNKHCPFRKSSYVNRSRCIGCIAIDEAVREYASYTEDKVESLKYKSMVDDLYQQ